MVSRLEYNILSCLRESKRASDIRLTIINQGEYCPLLGSFYFNLHRLERRGLIVGEYCHQLEYPNEVLQIRGGNRIRYYILTDSGRCILKQKIPAKTLMDHLLIRLQSLFS